MKRELEKLPNIGKVAANKLAQAGIETVEQLQTLGSKEAFLRVRVKADPEACCSMLFGLEGAIQGVRWHTLSEEKKEDLQTFFKSL